MRSVNQNAVTLKMASSITPSNNKSIEMCTDLFTRKYCDFIKKTNQYRRRFAPVDKFVKLGRAAATRTKKSEHG